MSLFPLYLSYNEFRMFKALNVIEQWQERIILFSSILSCEILFLLYCSPTLLTYRSPILEILNSCTVAEAKQTHGGGVEKNRRTKLALANICIQICVVLPSGCSEQLQFSSVMIISLRCILIRHMKEVSK